MLKLTSDPPYSETNGINWGGGISKLLLRVNMSPTCAVMLPLIVRCQLPERAAQYGR